MSYLKSYKGFADVRNEPFYLDIIKDYNKLRQLYFSSMDNIDLYMKIEELTARDQFVRATGMYLDRISEQEFQDAGNGFRKALTEKDSMKAEEFKKVLFHQIADEYEKTTSALMHKVDSLNVARLMEITEKHGWQERAWIILWHQRGTYGTDHYVWNHFKPIIDKEIANGTMSRTFWDAFDQHKEMMESGVFGTIQVGERSKKIKPLEKEKIKG
jgi:hypothetical protein